MIKPMENKKYSWDPAQTFTLTGNEFGLVLHSLKAVLDTPEAQKILLAAEASKVIEKYLEKGVKEGTVQEVKDL
jgi:hypothetical protein